MDRTFLVALVLLTGLGIPGEAAPALDLRPEKVFVADSQKTKFYVPDGLIVGGDEAIDDVVVLDIRHSRNQGFERVVIDLEGNKNGEPAAIQRPPYYQVEVSQVMKRLVFTIWGKPKLAFDAAKVKAAFGRSKAVKRVQLLPILERDRWMFVVHLAGDHPVEIFELNHPVRIIADLRSGAAPGAKGKGK